jgi:hypothetical protein
MKKKFYYSSYYQFLVYPRPKRKTVSQKHNCLTTKADFKDWSVSVGGGAAL